MSVAGHREGLHVLKALFFESVLKCTEGVGEIEVLFAGNEGESTVLFYERQKRFIRDVA